MKAFNKPSVKHGRKLEQGWNSDVLSWAIHSICLFMFNCIKPLGLVQQARRPTAAFAKKKPLLLSSLPSLKQSVPLPRALFQRTSFLHFIVFSRPWDPTTTVVQMHL